MEDPCGELQKKLERLEAELAGYRQREKALRGREELFRTIVENTDDLIARVDGEGRIIYVNRTAEKIFGIRAEECIGRSAFDFVHPDDRERSGNAFQAWVLERIPSLTFENRQVNRATGQIHDLVWTVNLHFDGDGRLVNMTAIAHDMTERCSSCRTRMENPVCTP